MRFYKNNLERLKEAENTPYEVEIKISAAKDACDHCKEWASKTMTISEAYENMLAHLKGCTRSGGCRCAYLNRAKRDSEGNLMLKPKPEISEEEIKRQQAMAAFQKVANKQYSNTAYGKRKERERAYLYRQSLGPGERKEFDRNNTVVFVVIIAVVLLLLYLIGGQQAVMKWLQR